MKTVLQQLVNKIQFHLIKPRELMQVTRHFTFTLLHSINYIANAIVAYFAFALQISPKSNSIPPGCISNRGSS